MASQERAMPFIKNLASSDRKLRTSALTSLHTFLSAKHISSALSPIDILKLWKGLFYAVWMCDRPIPQQKLCAELADLIYILPRDAVVPWVRGFWATMSREWTSIDVLRMEKFLLLVRRVVGAGFKWMKTGGQNDNRGDAPWDADRVSDTLRLLTEWPFSPSEEAELPAGPEKDNESLAPQTIPVGMKIHVLDIWVDEAEKVGLLDEDDEEASKILQQISEHVDKLEQKTTSPAVRVRSKESLADDRLPASKMGASIAKATAKDTEMADDGDGDGDCASWDGFDD
ncbi:nucleolar protein,Nop52-domain-containing protein [Lasiosphaeria hispida]|uniref:Nucleolar protein,Nop52-domain-containing protein n=1 Tax=Lasiosphaeria hispida TaxID=260671 RepID=A0AAJ0HHK9_9PEZI|nr:nucleolar protein,Nop52-domain-containing protein [Lasiosphaeria hispida]